MALSKKDLITLAKTVANADPQSQVAYSFGEDKFSYVDLQETLRKEFKELAGTNALYRQNKNLIFELMEETIDDVLPKKVLDQYGVFAEIKTFPQGSKPVFTQRISSASRSRAKQFITKVGLAGIYEVFKLDSKTYEIPMTAFGGAAQVGFEEFLDGRVDFADLLDIIMEGLDRAVYIEIENALVAAIDNLPTANITVQTSFDEAEMDRLLSISDAYGRGTIYCTFEFAATMVPDEGWRSGDLKTEHWYNGYIGNYKGHQVIVLPQSYEDETNEVKVIDPSYAWIIPTGSGNDKPVKVAIEGDTAIKEFENYDWSRDMQVYKKMGVAAIMTNNICVYQNTSLTRE